MSQILHVVKMAEGSDNDSSPIDDGDRLMLELKTLTVKKEFMFAKLQKVYDFSKSVKIDDYKNVQMFLIRFEDIEYSRPVFEKLLLQLTATEFQLNPSTTSTSSDVLGSYDDLFLNCKMTAENCRKLLNKPNTQASQVPSMQGYHSDNVRPLLPKIQLFEFDGNIENWATFYDTFLSLVHNRNFEEIDKFHYLISCLKPGPALNIVKSLPLTAANYQTVWKSLIEKYQNKRLLTNKYFEKMIAFTPISKGTVQTYTSFIENFDHSIKAIKALKIDNLENYLFCFIALRGLDWQTRRLFEEGRPCQELPTFDELMMFINRQIKILENSSHNTITNNNSLNRSLAKVTPSKFVLAAAHNKTNKLKLNSPISNQYTCTHCKQNHLIYRCEQFRQLPIHERIDRITNLQLCTNCLKNHNISECASTMTCGVCLEKHHYLLHRIDNLQQPSSSNTQETLFSSRFDGNVLASSLIADTYSPATDSVNQPNLEVLHAVRDKPCYEVVLGTAIVNVRDISGQYQSCRAVIDSGAQCSFVSLDCAQRLGLVRKKCNFSIAGLGGEIVKNYGVVRGYLYAPNPEQPTYPVDMVVVSKVSSEMPNVSFPQDVRNQYKGFKLADPQFYKKMAVDILLGNDIVPNLTLDKPLILKPEIPTLISTVFGYVVSGRLNCNASTCKQNLYLTVTDTSLDKTLRQFWELEELPCNSVSDPLELLAEEIYSKYHCRDSSGRYIVPLPFAPDYPKLGESRTMAERRLFSTERKISRNPVLCNAYNNFMKEYEQLDHMELYRGSESSKYLIPHHSILRPESSSTPLRVVFDASAKTSTNISLNDILLTGKNLYCDILSIILNFRLFEYALTSDICKMYRAILIRPCDRKYQHILYRHTPSDPIQEYELKTITYGVNCSPFLAIRTLHQLALDEGERFPEAATVVRAGIYMDDILWSVKSCADACLLQDQLIDFMQSGGFVLKKWSSNKQEILERVPEEHRECPLSFVKDNTDTSIKVLGLQWSPGRDIFRFSVAKTDLIMTKRSVLRILASIFDPVGFIAPCTFIAKCLMQDLWKLGIGWDESLPPVIADRWSAFIAELPILSQLEIERHALCINTDECELVGFCDASNSGYAACVYVITKNNNTRKVSLLTAKSKVAPLKVISIPRLELMGAVTLAKLIKYILNSLSRVKITNITALSDSTIVLSWLQTDLYKLKTFVCNRVALITEVLPPSVWRHVLSENNMADICSRGALPSQLREGCTQWLNGPVWLSADRDQWPVTTHIVTGDHEVPEVKVASLLVQKEEFSDAIQFCESLFNRFSSLTLLQRVVARILRWSCTFCKKRSEPLSLMELNHSNDVIIKLVQRAYFKPEIDFLSMGKTFIPSLKRLSPFLDQDGFLRVGGRLTQSELPYNTKHPLLLPKGSRFVQLLIEYTHKKHMHVGPRALQNILSQSYWILAARSRIRSVLCKCITCFKYNPNSLQVKMGDLPHSRLVPNKVFEHVGVDMGGPFFIKESLRRNARVDKAYLCLFICFSTKAVHLEVVSALTAECFLAALDRLVARRGRCACLYSDCGTNFIATSRYLKEVQVFLRTNKLDIENQLIDRQIEWKFNPPSAPHMGGLWEAGIKSAKYHLKRAIGDKSLTFEELTTVFCKIESIMNSRPLCPLPTSDNPSEFDVLTPAHFLIGKSANSVPEYEFKEVVDHRLSRWQYIQKCSQMFWKRWSSDYLNTLQQREKWFSSSSNIKLNDLVLIKTDHTPSCNWPIGIVQELHAGKDNLIRVVTVRTSKGTFRRPVQKLCPLPFND